MPNVRKPKKKILFVITKSNFGGAQRYVFDLAAGLPKSRYDSLVAFGGAGILKDKLREAKVRAVEIPALARDISPAKDISVFFKLLGLIRREQPDIVHLNSSKIGGLGALAARVYTLYLKVKTKDNTAGVKRIVFTAHGWAFKEERKRLQRASIAFFSWLTAALCDAVITVSRDDLFLGRRLPFAKSKMTLVHNGVSRKAETLGKADARHAIRPDPDGAAEDGIWIGTISELHKNKGVDILLKAFARASGEKQGEEVRCVIIGGGEEEKKLKDLAAELNIADRVLFAGEIAGAAKYLPAFDIFTLTSRKEGLPYALIEAGNAGLPVVASDVGGIPEIITDMRSGMLVRIEDYKETAEALLFMLNNPLKRARMGEALKAKVKSEFKLSKMIELTAEVYEK